MPPSEPPIAYGTEASYSNPKEPIITSHTHEKCHVCGTVLVTSTPVVEESAPVVEVYEEDLGDA